MMPSLATLLPLVVPQLPAALVSPAVVPLIEKASVRLPPISVFGFECHLMQEGTRVDLATRIGLSDGSAAVFAGTSDIYRGPSMADPLWWRIGKLCRVWAAEPESASFDALWLEFDRAQLAACPLHPSIAFFAVRRAAERSWRQVVAAFVERILPSIDDCRVEGTQRGQFETCLDVTAPFAKLVQLGIALGRGGADIRVCLRVPLDDLAPCLAALGLADRGEQIVDVVASIDRSCLCTLHVDIGPRFGEVVGIELRGHDASAWRSMLRCLYRLRLCSIAEAVGIAHWMSDPAALGLAKLPPPTLGRLPADSREVTTAAAWRLPSHVKLNFAADGAVSAKTYLGAGFLWPGDLPAARSRNTV